jgi:hypothetical protein
LNLFHDSFKVAFCDLRFAFCDLRIAIVCGDISGPQAKKTFRFYATRGQVILN